ncbi:hypothetical protein D9758_013700 [Tetrapyrgos nigripes]|uniref:Ketoreductase domain-containing protein n=1 Tax=Tetrapyrgos nigripes TaxID=182062 RepID=A0A8H5CLG9_9AGAR|nr:hypothetical protein D9758_013700 [Tetrapyrgos nigripes]
MKIENRTFIISGGSSGLGLATAHLFVTHKGYVSVLDVEPPPSDLPSSRVKYFKTDITSVQDIQKAVDGTVAWTNETKAPLRGVINCAGVGTASRIIDSNDEPHDPELWHFTVGVNLTGTFDLTRLALRHMVRLEPESGPDAERGVIIMVSSSAAFEGQPGQAGYAATKGAIASMTLPLSRDLARHGIRVMTIAPSLFDSKMMERLTDKARNSIEKDLVYPKRFGQPDEFAQTVKWILETLYMNGETIRLSGAGRLPAKM